MPAESAETKPIEQTGDAAGASGAGTSTLLVTSTQCYQTGCTVEDAVLSYNGTTGAYVGSLIASVNDPWGLAIHPIRESLLVVSRADATVREYDVNTGSFVRVLVKPGAEGLNAPQGIALSPDGRLFVASNQVSGQLDKVNGILEFDSTTGAFIAKRVDGGSSLSETCPNPVCLRGPNAMTVAPNNNHIYVASSINDTVQEYLLDGTFLGAFSSSKLIGPGGIAVRPPGTTNAGNLMVSSRWINPTNDFDDSILEFSGTTRALVATNGGVFGNSSLIRPGPLAWHTDGSLLIGERAGETPPFFADRVGRRNGTTGASMAQFTPVGDTHAHQLTALLLTYVNFATDDSDADGDTDLKDLADFQNCFPSSVTAQCLTPFDDNKTATVGRWDFLAFLGNFHGPRRLCTSASDCSDADVCTTDQCLNGFCSYTAAANGTNCADSLFCNGPESCSSGVCRGRSTCIDSSHCNEATDTCRQCLVNTECDDGNPCTDDSCSNFSCVHVAHTRSCDDGSPCTTNDHCAAGACVGGPAPNCNDNNVCTTDSCDPVLGCIHTDNLLPCDDGNACSLQDFCLQGTCRPGRDRNCNDNNPCTDDSCNVNTGCVHHNNTDTCDDGDPCTENDVCAVGLCNGAPKNCADSVTCTIDRCVNGVCQNVPDNARCSDGNWCNGTETCDAVLGCAPGTPPCNDNIPCTVDNCDPDAQTCSHTANHAACSDGLFCNGAEQCSLTLGCQPGTPPNCNDSVSCTTDACNESSDTCDHTANNSACDDNNVCTDDVCSAAGCSHPFNTAPCNDAQNCTINDTCANGVCAGVPKTCPAGQSCDPGDGQCKQCLNNGQCNDNNPCTDDTCNAGVCAHANNTAACNDNQFCTLTDVCSGGSCVGSGNRCPGQLCNESTDACVQCLVATDCQDNNVCTDNVCNNGTCQFPPNTASCSDGLFCNGAEVCGGGSCQPGTPPNCSDGITCTVDTCNENTDSCDHTPNNNACNDGLFCNGLESCSASQGCLAGTPPNCSDNIPCTVDTCNENTHSCDHAPNNQACDDGLFCNGSETCSAALGCQAGSPPDCSPLSGQCTNGVCNENTDSCVAQPKPDNSPCNDNLFCTVNDKCISGACTGGVPRDCSSLDTQCADGVCDEAQDACVTQNLPNGTGCDDGLFCTLTDQCQNGNCLGSGVRCTVAPNTHCNETTDVCDECTVNADCNDNNNCTDDTCVNGQCFQFTNSNPCDDGLFCTSNDHCLGGLCVGGDACPGQMCDEDHNTCVECITNEHCAPDANPCTDTICNNGLCEDVNNSASCDDGNFCTVIDTCSNGICQGSGNPCSAPLICNEATDSCVECITAADCSDDGNPCTDTACQNGVCGDVNNTALCDDGLNCTVNDQCSGGLCVGQTRDCNDNINCTVDSCGEPSGCVHTPDNSVCDDNLFCTGVESCDPQLGCVSGPDPCAGQTCDETNHCTP